MAYGCEPTTSGDRERLPVGEAADFLRRKFPELLRWSMKAKGLSLPYAAEVWSCEGGDAYIVLHTATHFYEIHASTLLPRRRRHGYLGCTATARAPLPGETWLRGGDLPDGVYSEETWNAIMASIVAYELQTPVPVEPTARRGRSARGRKRGK